MRVPPSVSGLPRPFWVLWSGTLINRLGTMVEPFLAIYLTRTRHMSLASTGLVLTVWGVGSLVSQPTAGVLADRIGRRATLAGGMLLSAGAMIVLAYARSLGAMLPVVLVLGLTIDAYRPASSALVADIVAPEDRVRAFGLLFWAVNLGFSVALVAGGWLAAHGATWLFWVDAITSALFGLVVWLAIAETRVEVGEHIETGLLVVLRDRLMLGYVAVTLAYATVYLQVMVGLPLAMKLSGRSPTEYGLAVALNGILIVLVQPLVSSRLARRDHTLVLATGMAIVGAGFGLTALASSTLGYALTVAVWTGGEIVTATVGAAIVADLAPAHLRGRYNGVWGLAWAAAGLIAPLFATRLLAVNGWILWVCCAALCGAAAVALAALAGAIRTRSEGARMVVAAAAEPLGAAD